MRLVYSEEAVADLVRLRAFIAETDPAAASGTERIARTETLCLFPQMGVEVPQAPQPGVLRDMAFGNYVVRYAAQTESIVVLRLWRQLENRAESG